MTLNDNDMNNGNRFRRVVLTAVATLLAGAFAAGCGGGDEDAVAKTGKRAKADAAAAAGTPPANAAEKQSRLAEAVVDGKTTAPVDMRYDLLSKPVLGQPFEIELTFEPRLAADSLEVELTEAPGLAIVGEKVAKFAPVKAAETYTTKVLVQGDNPGLFYVGVVAKMSTTVQTESRAFALPVVIGNPPEAQKSSPSQDATGQAVQSMPAQEPK